MRDRFRRTAECSHTSTISVITPNGLESVICEVCGDITHRYEPMASGDVERSAFEQRRQEPFLKKLIELVDEETADQASSLAH